jgi:methyl-accepting chemotaxis protein
MKFQTITKGDLCHIAKHINPGKVGSAIPAIKLYRDMTNQGLKESKDAIDAARFYFPSLEFMVNSLAMTVTTAMGVPVEDSMITSFTGVTEGVEQELHHELPTDREQSFTDGISRLTHAINKMDNSMAMMLVPIRDYLQEQVGLAKETNELLKDLLEMMSE